MRVLGMIAAALLALPATAAAAPEPAAYAAKVVSKTAKGLTAQSEFSLEAGDGYSVMVEGTGRTVALTVVGRGLAVASYVTRGRASPGGIEARFGHFGRVSVRFVPSGRESRRGPPRRCKGRPMIVRSGFYVGRIEFRGEDGYVHVDARRVRGRSSTLPRWRCNHRQGREAAAARVGYDTATVKASTPQQRIVFEASTLKERGGPALTFFLVTAKETKGSVRIARLLFTASDGPRAFVFDRSGRTASIRPPKPFHGTAIFQRNPDGSTSWSGSLSVALPGAVIDLTGPAFRVKLPRPGTLDEDFEFTLQRRSPVAIERGIRGCANRNRRAAGLDPLSWSLPLSKAARLHAGNMARGGFFDHTDPQGRSVDDRVAIFDGAGRFTFVGENIAAGYDSAASACRGWMNSSGHRENILNPEYTHIGGGFARGGPLGRYYVQVFAAG